MNQEFMKLTLSYVTEDGEIKEFSKVYEECSEEDFNIVSEYFFRDAFSEIANER